MGEIAEMIAAIIAVRRQSGPKLLAEIAQWHRADAAVAALEQVTAQLGGHPAAPPGLTAQLDQLRIGSVRPSITGAIEQVQRLETRIRRGTLTIAIGGGVGAGKSTIARSITGLTDAELPTGRDTPVTAVPSRLRHTAGRRRVVLSLHTYDTFRATHLQPRYARAGLGEPPTDIEAFRAATYPEQNPADPIGPLGELRAMQAALWSYEGLLDRPGRALELSGEEVDRLQEYVAYPRAGDNLRYLGVRDVSVECPFPHECHRGLTLVDLPGPHLDSLEVTRRYFADYRYDVDVMLLVQRRAGAGQAAHDDERILSVLDPVHARDGRRPDLVLRVDNAHTPGLESGRSGVLAVDARVAQDVSKQVLRPVLNRLDARLPAVDARLANDTRALTRPVKDQLINLAAEIKAIMSQLPALPPDTAEELYRRVDSLQTRLGTALQQLLADLADRRRRRREQLRAAVDEIHIALLQWLRDGLGRGSARWYAEALRATARDGPKVFYTAELTRIRAEILNRYNTLDGHLERRLDAVRSDLATALAREFHPLVGDRSGAAALARLADLARTATEPCPQLAAALDGLLAVRLDYQTHLHPRVLTRLPSRADQLPAVPMGRDAVERLYELVRQRAELAAEQTRSRLLREIAVPEQVLYAAVSRFHDGLMTGAGAEREIRQLARAYRSELWPDLSESLDRADARVAAVVRAADELLVTTANLCPAISRDEPAENGG